MNVELQYDLELPAAIYLDTLDDDQAKLQINQYSVSLQMLTGTEDKQEINIAMERLKVFVYQELANTIFINQDLEERALILSSMGVNVTTLPEDPVDQIVGIMLYCKLNSIMEGRIKITQVDISSTLGDSVWYKHYADDPLGPFVQYGWWNDEGTDHDDISDSDTPENVVRVVTNTWAAYDLTWPDAETDPPTQSNTVMFAKFTQDENK